MAIIGSNFFDAKRELFDDVVDDGNGIGLIMALIDFESPDTQLLVLLCPDCAPVIQLTVGTKKKS